MKCEVQSIEKLGDSPSSNHLPLRPLRLCGETQAPGSNQGTPEAGFSPRRQARKGSEGDSYRKLRPSIGICILNSVHFSQLAEYHSEFRLRTRSGLELTNCLEIHLLELPKYAPLDDNEVIADPRDQWMYFFRRAEGSTVEELLDRLPDPVFKRAVGVLEMISRTPDQRRHYDARLKWELDENTRIQTAFEEGEIKGREEGEIKLIQTLQEILGGPVSDAAVFHGRSLEQLRAMTEELRKKIQRRT